MADKMMRIAGRDDQGLAKAIKTDANGNIETKLTGSPAIELINVERELGVAEVVNAVADANNMLSKTAYVYSEKDGYAGIEVKINNQWVSLLAARDEIFRDSFLGADAPIDPAKWEVAKMGTFDSAGTYAKYYNNRLRLAMHSTSGYSHLFVTTDEKFNVTTERVFEFTLDETNLMSVTTTEFVFGLTPTKPINDPSIANRLYLLRVFAGKVVNQRPDETGYTLSSPLTNARYVLEFTPTSMKTYREGELILETALTATEPDYHLYMQFTTRSPNGISSVDVGEFIAWSKSGEARVYGKQLWVKSTTDVVPGEMRVVFQNEFDERNKVTILLAGQA